MNFVRSIRWKLVALVFTSMLTLSAVLVALLVQRQVRSIDEAQLDKGIAYGRQASRQLEPAVAFDDVQTARDVLEGFSRDEEVIGSRVVDANGQVIYGEGLSSFDASLTGEAGRVRAIRRAEELIVVAPVASREGKQGWVQLRLSRMRQIEARSSHVTRSLLVLGVALVVGFAAAWALARPLSRRIERMTKLAEDVAVGKADTCTFDDSSGDEVGRLNAAFRRMLDQIKELRLEQERRAADERDRLEQQVRERTSELTQRHKEVNLLLENVCQGILLVLPDGSIAPQRSAIVDQWFGAPSRGAPFWEYLTADEGVRARLMLGWDQLQDGFLPEEVCMAELATTLVQPSGRRLRMHFQPIVDDAAKRSLLVIEDVTAEHDRRVAETESRELGTVLRSLARDRHGFMEFIAEVGALIGGLSKAELDEVQLRRSLHTIKGIAGMYEFESLASVCHEIEDKLAMEEPFSSSDQAALEAVWHRISSAASLLDDAGGAKVEVDQAELHGLAGAIAAEESKDALLRRVHAIPLEQASRRLGRIAEQARALAERTGRPDVIVTTDDGGLKLERDELRPFWAAFPHVVRNAFSHAFEPGEERRALGKPEHPKLFLRTRLENEALIVEATDDGRGIDWDRIATLARKRGLPADAPEDLVAAIFANGFSTRDRADAMAGRGEGMGAVKAAVDELGGEIKVDTTARRGTTLHFVLPGRLASRVSRRTTRPPPSSSAAVRRSS